MRKPWRSKAMLAALGTALAILPGCGGGGNGGGGAPPGAQTQVTYTGKTTQAVVNQAVVFDTLSSARLFLPACTATPAAAKPLAKR